MLKPPALRSAQNLGMKRWMLPTALGCVALLLAPAVGQAALWLVAVLVFAGLWLFVMDSRWFQRLRRDPYSIAGLREEEEKARFRQVEEEHMQMQKGGGYCVFCDEDCPEGIAACPRCGRMV